MSTQKKPLSWRAPAIRMAADMLLIQCSMIAALATSAVYKLATGRGVEADALVSGFTHYYTRQFLALSPLFLVVFFLCGLYTHTRGYAGTHKHWAVIRATGLAAVLFLIATYVLSGNVPVGRSVAIPFAVLAAVSLSGVRVLKAEIDRRYILKSAVGVAASPPRGRVLVVGGAGYIGSLLVEQLLNRGYVVRVLDTLLYGDDALRTVKDHPRFELQVGDCRNIQDVVKAVRGADSVIHLAAIVGDPACDQHRESALEINYAATRMLVEIAKGNGVTRFLFASSCSVYGATNVEVDEKAAVHPVSLYGQTKVDSEEVVLRARSDAFHPTVLRYATVFGLGYRPRFDLIVNLLTAQAKQEGFITIYNGTQWRPFIHVRDLVEATVRLVEAPIPLVCGEIFNVGDSHLSYTLQQVAEAVREVFPQTRIEYRENPDRRNYRVNFDKLQRRFRFEASYSLQDGIEELKKGIEERMLDYRDLRYHNQRFLEATGVIGHKEELDGLVMAAFAAGANHRGKAVAA